MTDDRVLAFAEPVVPGVFAHFLAQWEAGAFPADHVRLLHLRPGGRVTGWFSAHRHPDGTAGAVLTYRLGAPFTHWRTRVQGGPLDGQSEDTPLADGDEAAVATHIKWHWRVQHCDLTHPEHFQRPRRSRKA